jgi:threonine aldolase
MFCLSKGLGAPVGSMLVGTKDDIERARLYRKRLGGGMRQAGILAAAGLIALEESPARLCEDHENARLIADILQADPTRVRTNIVIFDITKTGMTTPAFSAELRKRGVLANGINATHMRMVTHQNVTRAQCRQAAELAAGL